MRSPFVVLVFISVFSLSCVFLLYHAGSDIISSLSPQGCRMSWMSPSYVLQAAFNDRWTPLASRYSLYLYREVGWESPSELHGSPVLFIPGNAGSSHQVRSIASSATRQFFSSPYHISSEFESHSYKHLDFFALEFNEDLSAFHGPTLDAETSYARAAISYILALYPEPTSVIVLAHSMGGTVATALLPHPNISAIITMSTPHKLPPARLDRRVDTIFASNRRILAEDPTPIISLCGGATDLLVPAESCIIPVSKPMQETYRRTVFTSALEGAWTGVGHKEMVWCHQVRWRIARAAIELAAVSQSSPTERGKALDRWLRDGHTLPEGATRTSSFDVNGGEVEYLGASSSLVLRQPSFSGSRTYFLPIPLQPRTKFTLYLSRGSLAPISPHTPLPLRVSVFQCSRSPFETCTNLSPTVLKLVPEPIAGMSFPVPDEGTDESEGVVVFAADVEAGREEQSYVAVHVEGADGRGWIVAGFSSADVVVSDIGVLDLAWSRVKLHFSGSPLWTQVSFPKLLSSSLLVYRLTPQLKDESSCSDAQFVPILQHTSHQSETHYFSLDPHSPRKPILLHSHASGPFLPPTAPAAGKGFNLTVYSSDERGCALESMVLTVDWWGSLGRWAGRYAQAAVAWGVGICALILHYAWSVTEAGGPSPSIVHSLAHIVSYVLPRLLPASIVISLLPLPESLWLGNAGEPAFAIIAPILLGVTVGLIAITWVVVGGLVQLVGRITAFFPRRALRAPRPRETSSRRNALLSMGLVVFLIIVIIPWQVAFLCAWIYHFYTCAANASLAFYPAPSTAISLIPRQASSSNFPTSAHGASRVSSSPSSQPPSPSSPSLRDAPAADANVLDAKHNQDQHLLLIMAWLLPIAAPVLVVWVRTVAGSGIRAVWGSASGWGPDRNVLIVAPWLVLVEWAGSGGSLFTQAGILSWPRHAVLALAFTAFFAGPRAPYIVFEAASVVMALLVLVKIGRGYWSGEITSL
ncbi:PGAP1-domain-containing protein [Laetiporus sulphureus 93-53]|uniref:GPI inositol-deacylase n=1 Tax=Laetiporus sulphureus 93-53 TaxID=1314785 RepID=A0A165DTQ9_9APHY|nr:PGAP1-domain-containing protein [Laetiporus sulphureus 93-53]KZT05617.1 PGAP1-domain-containing protein [Laetiporus sulphureus 93-53]